MVETSSKPTAETPLKPNEQKDVNNPDDTSNNEKSVYG